MKAIDPKINPKGTPHSVFYEEEKNGDGVEKFMIVE